MQLFCCQRPQDTVGRGRGDVKRAFESSGGRGAGPPHTSAGCSRPRAGGGAGRSPGRVRRARSVACAVVARGRLDRVAGGRAWHRRPLVATGAEIGHPAAPSPRRHAERPTEAADLALAGRTRRSHPAPPDWTVRILCYAEFDPFAGIGQTVDDFRAARAEVALPCLLHDVARAASGLVRRTCDTVG